VRVNSNAFGHKVGETSSKINKFNHREIRDFPNLQKALKMFSTEKRATAPKPQLLKPGLTCARQTHDTAFH
jgi:hypothetical protein